MSDGSSILLRRLSLGFTVLAGITFALISLGASVRANGAGLACPDWPLCFGQVIPRFDIKVAFEWGHRAMAGSVSLGLAALSWAGLRDAEVRSWLAPRLAVAWVLLAVQVVFGGLTVLLLLAPWTVSGHLLLGNTFCLVLLWIGRDAKQRCTGEVPSETIPVAVGVLTAAVAICLFVQLGLGGMVAGHYAGLACPSFPTCDGESLVPTLSGLVGLHVVHRANGFLLLIGFIALVWATRRMGRVAQLARLGLVLVILQIGVGVTDVLLQLRVEVTVLHTAVAAAIVLNTAMLVRDVLHGRRSERSLRTPVRFAEA